VGGADLPAMLSHPDSLHPLTKGRKMMLKSVVTKVRNSKLGSTKIRTIFNKNYRIKKNLLLEKKPTLEHVSAQMDHYQQSHTIQSVKGFTMRTST
jgi:hypothetical protein